MGPSADRVGGDRGCTRFQVRGRRAEWSPDCFRDTSRFQVQAEHSGDAYRLRDRAGGWGQRFGPRRGHERCPAGFREGDGQFSGPPLRRTVGVGPHAPPFVPRFAPAGETGSGDRSIRGGGLWQRQHRGRVHGGWTPGDDDPALPSALHSWLSRKPPSGVSIPPARLAAPGVSGGFESAEAKGRPLLQRSCPRGGRLGHGWMGPIPTRCQSTGDRVEWPPQRGLAFPPEGGSDPCA
jgi:hypothetical protein